MSPRDELADLHAKIQIELAKKILSRIQEEDVKAADLNVARQLLKDNEITAPPGANTPLDELRQRMNLPDIPTFPGDPTIN